ncbi:MAG: LuxR C-terminal-related transcriptional regulator [Ferruginibacter sp.]
MKETAKSSTLTKRETEIMEALSKGLLYKEIANSKHISIETVKKHTKNIYKKLNVRNRTEAVNWFLNDIHHKA